MIACRHAKHRIPRRVACALGCAKRCTLSHHRVRLRLVVTNTVIPINGPHELVVLASTICTTKLQQTSIFGCGSPRRCSVLALNQGVIWPRPSRGGRNGLTTRSFTPRSFAGSTLQSPPRSHPNSSVWLDEYYEMCAHSPNVFS